MAPITTALIERGFQQAVLILEGSLSLLPLHIVQGDIIFSQAPSAFTLYTCYHNLLQRVSMIAETQPPSLACVSNPHSTLTPLTFSDIETDEISKLFNPA